MPKATAERCVLAVGAVNDGGFCEAKRMLKELDRQYAAPVDSWSPPFLGALDIRIAADGVWWHEGRPIRRDSLTRLFARVLRREPDGSYSLVTPFERWRIEVEDAPFLAVDVELAYPGRDQVAVFETNVGDRVPACAAHPVRFRPQPGGGPAIPYVLVRRGLEARADRKCFHRLAELCEIFEHQGRRWFGLRSSGKSFPFLPASELEAED